MASENEIFYVVGPWQLTCVDWSKFSHRSSVAASLVKGAYILERDRQKRRHAPYALAPPWYHSFGFHLNRVLVDPDDNSIFGAVYEFTQNSLLGDSFSPNWDIPKHVIAFRGTLLKLKTGAQDIILDTKCILNNLHKSPRAKIAIQTVQEVVARAGPRDVCWLAGHSLGSAIALLVGRNMVVKMNHPLETYLFNPPYPSLPLQLIENENIREGIQVVHNIAIAANSLISQNDDDENFRKLHSWIPKLFLNRSDLICARYIEYFEHRERMEARGGDTAEIGRIAAGNSMRSMISSACGRDSEPYYLIPSAHVTINRSCLSDPIESHKLSQWWTPDLQLQYKLYQSI